ncbi:hypothetical protein sphantq_02669 [Sphingobium sp. AntQ-1]|nr:hypothetical protein sphantq_02669 [Sphingobium sp. AntQ-1]
MTKIPAKIGGLPSLFIITVLVPTAIATIYFTLSSSVYTSESRFVVKSSEKKSTGGLGALLRSGGFSNATDEAFVATDYIISRDALKNLNRDGLISQAYGSRDVSFLNRFNGLGLNGSMEKLYSFYQDQVEIKYDGGTGIAVLTVKAFSPEAAHKINLRLLDLTEELVNRLNKRGREDVVSNSSREVEDAKEKARAAALALSDYRNREGVVDPEKQATVQLQMISKLQDDVISTKTQLVQLQMLTPQNPQVPVLRARIAELNREIAEQTGLVAGNQKSLAATAAQFQRLQLETQLADRDLGAAMTSLQEARNEARRKQAYVERIVQPSLPDSASAPKRLRGILSIFAIGLVLWAITSMLLAGVREHGD